MRLWRYGALPNTPATLPAALLGDGRVHLRFSAVGDRDDGVGFPVRLNVGDDQELSVRDLFRSLGDGKAEKRKLLRNYTLTANLTIFWNWANVM